MGYWKIYLNNLVSRGRIDSTMEQYLNSMLVGDPESSLMAKTILSNIIKEYLLNQLNDEQQVIFNNIISYIEDETEEKYEAFMINGYAGTGKTFLAKRIIEYLSIVKTGKIAVTAPTNKAVKVLNENNEMCFIEDGQRLNGEVCYCTTHKYLGLKEVVDNEGNISFIPKENNQGMFDYLIVDESSMINEYIAKLIFSTKNKQKIILLGDDKQIPPVGEKGSILFDMPSIHRETLNTIVRQKSGNPIIDLSIKIRKNLSSQNPFKDEKKRIKKTGEVKYLTMNEGSNKIKELLNKEEFKSDPSFFKIIAWRNKTLSYLNEWCRQCIYGKDVESYMVGERLIAENTIYVENSGRYNTIFNTSMEMEVIKKIKTKLSKHIYIKALESYIDVTLDVYELTVKSENGSNHNIYVTYDKNSYYTWLNILKKVKNACIKKKSAECWVGYYDLGKLIANVDYAYAISIHKAQGSTYKNVLMFDNDISANWIVEERNKIRYTGCTRASNNLYIVRDDS